MSDRYAEGAHVEVLDEDTGAWLPGVIAGLPTETPGMIINGIEVEGFVTVRTTLRMSNLPLVITIPLTMVDTHIRFDRSETSIYWDDQLCSLVVRESKAWIVSVTPMIFNDRVLLTDRRDYPNHWVAGWCYPKGGAALLAAKVWDPDVDRAPVGFIKLAADLREDADHQHG